jgi:hypothetical protein
MFLFLSLAGWGIARSYYMLHAKAPCSHLELWTLACAWAPLCLLCFAFAVKFPACTGAYRGLVFSFQYVVEGMGSLTALE